MTDREFIHLYPDTDTVTLAEDMHVCENTVRNRAKKLGLKKSEKFVMIWKRKKMAVKKCEMEGRMEMAEHLRKLRVCYENYGKIDSLVTDVIGTAGAAAKGSLTSHDIEALLADNMRRLLLAPSLSTEAKRLIAERNDLYMHMYALTSRPHMNVPDNMVEGYIMKGTL